MKLRRDKPFFPDEVQDEVERMLSCPYFPKGEWLVSYQLHQNEYNVTDGVCIDFIREDALGVQDADALMMFGSHGYYAVVLRTREPLFQSDLYDIQFHRVGYGLLMFEKRVKWW